MLPTGKDDWRPDGIGPRGSSVNGQCILGLWLCWPSPSFPTTVSLATALCGPFVWKLALVWYSFLSWPYGQPPPDLAAPAIPPMPKRPAVAETPAVAGRRPWTAMALPMTGQRRPKTCRLDIAPPPGEPWRAAVVERVRRVAGGVRLRNGHIVRPCFRRASMMQSNGALCDATGAVAFLGSSIEVSGALRGLWWYVAQCVDLRDIQPSAMDRDIRQWVSA